MKETKRELLIIKKNDSEFKGIFNKVETRKETKQESNILNILCSSLNIDYIEVV